MLEAKVEGQLVKAGPDSPETALCPACGGVVEKRRRRIELMRLTEEKVCMLLRIPYVV